MKWIEERERVEEKLRDNSYGYFVYKYKEFSDTGIYKGIIKRITKIFTKTNTLALS